MSADGHSAALTLDFRTLFHLELGYVIRSLRRLGVEEMDTEDVAAELFLAVHGALANYDPARPLRPWLFGFVFRFASQYRRKRRRRPSADHDDYGKLADDRPLADEELARARDRLAVLDALEELPLDRRAVFVMHELDGIPIPHVAAALEIPLGTAYTRLRQGRAEFVAAVRRQAAKEAHRGTARNAS